MRIHPLSLVLPALLLAACNDRREQEFHRVTFVLGDRLLVTLHDTPEFTPLNRAFQRLARKGSLATDAKRYSRSSPQCSCRRRWSPRSME